MAPAQPGSNTLSWGGDPQGMTRGVGADEHILPS